MKVLELEYGRTFPVAGEFGSVKIGIRVAVDETENIEAALDRMAMAAAHYNRVRFVDRNREAVLDLRNVLEATVQPKHGDAEDLVAQGLAGSQRRTTPYPGGLDMTTPRPDAPPPPPAPDGSVIRMPPDGVFFSPGGGGSGGAPPAPEAPPAD